MINTLKAQFQHLKDELLRTNRVDLILRLTAIMFLLYGHTNWALDIPTRIICSLMLFSSALLRSKLLWGILALAFVSTNAIQWYNIDNHKYLMTYWCLVCFLAVWHEQSMKLLQINGRLLLGLTFLFATLWKLITLEYFDGSFLHFTMLTDHRMEVPAMLGGTVPLESLDQNRELMYYYKRFPDPALQIKLLTGSTATLFATGWSYLTILVEGLLGLAFLINVSFFKKIRNVLLILFVIGTYYLLPVTGFGFLLTVMGLSQLSQKSSPKLFFVYLLTVALVQLSIIPLDKMAIVLVNYFS